MSKNLGGTKLKDASQVYFEIMWFTFFELKKKLLTVQPLNYLDAIQYGMYLIDHVYWYTFHYSSKIEICRFVTERSKMLYVEFLQMSREHETMKQTGSFPSVRDAFNFSMRKSIGTLVLGNHEFSLSIKKIETIRENGRSIFNLLNVCYMKQEFDSATNERIYWNDDLVRFVFNTCVISWPSILQKQKIENDLIMYISCGLLCFDVVVAFLDWSIKNLVFSVNHLDESMLEGTEKINNMNMANVDFHASIEDVKLWISFIQSSFTKTSI